MADNHYRNFGLFRLMFSRQIPTNQNNVMNRFLFIGWRLLITSDRRREYFYLTYLFIPNFLLFKLADDGYA